MWGRPRRGLWLSLAASLIVWNLVFDRQVQEAASQYARQQQLSRTGIGRPSSMDEVMRPALGRSAGVATAWAGVTLVAALALTRSLERRRGAPSASRTP
jgi:hypothetical protein